jgi:rubrerythrin
MRDNNNYDCIIDNGNVIDTTNGQGWICPRCKTVVAPNLLVCPVCNQKRTNETLAEGETLICG